MGTRLVLEIAPEFLAALLGVVQADIDRAFALVKDHHSSPDHDGYDTYKVMMEDPVASILADYTRPFEYEGETHGGTLGFGKWGFNRAWRLMCWNGLKVDPVCGSLKRVDYPPEVDDIINSLRFEETREFNWVVLADHCTGIAWG